MLFLLCARIHTTYLTTEGSLHLDQYTLREREREETLIDIATDCSPISKEYDGVHKQSSRKAHSLLLTNCELLSGLICASIWSVHPNLEYQEETRSAPYCCWGCRGWASTICAYIYLCAKGKGKETGHSGVISEPGGPAHRSWTILWGARLIIMMRTPGWKLRLLLALCAASLC